MDINLLKTTAAALVAPGKGILAADESAKTIQKRFDKIGLTSTPETNLAYRSMLFTTPAVEQYLSGVILFDETIRQEINGVSVPEYLESRGIIPGIKVDKGAVDMEGHLNEKVTEGLEGLDGRMEEYEKMGAKFAKWRAVITIGDGIPTEECILENAKRLAEYALICQNHNIVPILEPEVVRDGDYDLNKDQEVTTRTLKTIFEEVKKRRVVLEGLLLKPNMVTCGEGNPNQASPAEVAEATIDALKESVPAEVPGIVFLSGGQPPQMATDNLAAICKLGGPWALGFSFARALQGEALEIWSGKDENLQLAQKAFLERAKKVSEARML